MQISARNLLKGKVKRIIDGAVNSEVVIELAEDVEIVSIITKNSVERFNLSEGKEVYAIIKSSDVMVGID